MAEGRLNADSLFSVVDSMDLDALGRLFAEDASVAIANSAPAVGLADIRAGLTQLYDRLQGMCHSLVHVWTMDDYTIVDAAVTYHRLDGMRVTCPAATIIHVNSTGLIDDYRVFVDLAPLDD